MREIKFRAYDADDKVMRSWEEIDFTKDIGDDYYLVGYKTSAVSIKYDHEQMIMQYTGLKDKNGVEIYEGDIVRFLDRLDDPPFEAEGHIVYEQEDCGFKIVKRLFRYPLYTTKFVEYEVIGNIYENPELLKEQNK